jgi:hypothetical protein
MSGYVFVDAVMVAVGADESLGASPRAFDLLEGIMSGKCRRCSRPVDRRESDAARIDEAGRVRLPYAINRITYAGSSPAAPICDECADQLRAAP